MTMIALTGPAVEPLTLADVKAHLRLDGTAEDDYLAGLIRVARDHLERACGLVPITRRYRLHLESVSEDGVIQILKGPVQAIDGIRAYDAAGNSQDVPAGRFPFDRENVPARLSTPSGLLASLGVNGVDVDFTAGFGLTGNEVPDTIRRALLLHVAQMFEYRGSVNLADQPAVLPDGYERLLAPFRMRGL